MGNYVVVDSSVLLNAIENILGVSKEQATAVLDQVLADLPRHDSVCGTDPYLASVCEARLQALRLDLQDIQKLLRSK